jgi:hypothetical protein
MFCPTISIVKFKFEGIISSIVVPEFSPPLLDFSLEHEVIIKIISVIKRNIVYFKGINIIKKGEINYYFSLL